MMAESGVQKLREMFDRRGIPQIEPNDM